MLDIIVIPYRDEVFVTKYGPIVRDWHIILGLAEQDMVDSITIINRPNPPFLDLIRKKNGKSVLSDVLKEKADKIKFISSLSFDFSWLYKKRLWTVNCYNKIVSEVLSRVDGKSNNTTVVLDFTPMSKMPDKLYTNNGIIYWYDMIDNFSKHNRFRSKEKLAVKEKYKRISGCHNNLSQRVTCVSPGCHNEISNAVVLPNGLVNYNSAKYNSDTQQKFDFGFCGFVTDKFDVDFVKYLCLLNYSVVIWGDVYSQETKIKLESVGAIIKGKFSYQDFPRVFTSFKVGLVPYIKQLSHDESPLKIYEYLRHHAKVISLIKYEVVSDAVHYFESEYPSKDNLDEIISTDFDFNSKDMHSILDSASWTGKIKEFVGGFNLGGEL